MKDTNIKCNNRLEAKYALNYFLNNGCRWEYDKPFEHQSIYHINKKISPFESIYFEYPIIIYNGNNKDNRNFIYWLSIDDFDIETYNFIEAKHLMREEKLKRINDGRT